MQPAQFVHNNVSTVNSTIKATVARNPNTIGNKNGEKKTLAKTRLSRVASFPKLATGLLEGHVLLSYMLTNSCCCMDIGFSLTKQV